jgi:hypothetical protein
MAQRSREGKIGTETPRLKDLPVGGTVPERTVNHGSDGRFVVANGAANGRAMKTLARASLGADGDDDELVRAARTMYRALLREMPEPGASVRQLVASRCRHAVMATKFANSAARVGLATVEGIRLAEQSRAHDLAAQRLAVTALDLALREARSRPPVSFDPLERQMRIIEAEELAAGGSTSEPTEPNEDDGSEPST